MLKLRSPVLLLFAPLAACTAFADTPGGREENPVAACVQRGVAYFESIGSYPALKEPPNTGKAAIDVARERCQKAVTAF